MGVGNGAEGVDLKGSLRGLRWQPALQEKLGGIKNDLAKEMSLKNQGECFWLVEKSVIRLLKKKGGYHVQWHSDGQRNKWGGMSCTRPPVRPAPPTRRDTN